MTVFVCMYVSTVVYQSDVCLFFMYIMVGLCACVCGSVYRLVYVYNFAHVCE